MNNLLTPSNSELSFIKITGPDAVSFLQGQLTINISKLDDGQIRYCAQCDAKGKMVGLGFLFRLTSDYYFIQSKACIAVSLAQFKKFGVFAKVEFCLADEQTCIAASRAPELNEHSSVLFQTPCIAELEEHHLAATLDTDIVVKRQRDNSTNSLVVKNGVALLAEDMAEQWVPQMLNVQALNGIDFDKGCYMGQEVVARTRYLGKNKRALFTAHLPLSRSENIAINAPIYRQLGENWRKSGAIINYQQINEEVLLSLVLPNDISDTDKIAIDENGEFLVKLMPLPYVVQSETSTIKKPRQK